MLDTYRAALEVRNYQESSLNKNVQLAGQFLRNAQISDPQEITVCNVEEYLIQLRAKGRSAKTIKNHRTAIKVFCDFLTNRGMLNENPVHKIPSMDLPVEVPVYLPDDEVEKLYQIATQQGMLCEVTVALNTGLRMAELRRLQWADIDIEDKQLLVRKAKGKRPRVVPLNARAREALTNQKALYESLIYVFPGGEGGYHSRGLWCMPQMRGLDWWARTSVKWMQDGLPTLRELPKGRTGRGWHALRHTFATRAAKRGIDVWKLRDWMGHRFVETTLQYIHLARRYDAEIELL